MLDLMSNVCSFSLIKCEDLEFIKTLENMVFSMYNIWSPFCKLTSLKLVSAIFYQIFIFSPNDSPSKPMKNVFYLI